MIGSAHTNLVLITYGQMPLTYSHTDVYKVARGISILSESSSLSILFVMLGNPGVIHSIPTAFITRGDECSGNVMEPAWVIEDDFLYAKTKCSGESARYYKYQNLIYWPISLK